MAVPRKPLHEAPDWASLQRRSDEICGNTKFDKHSEKGLKTSAPRLYKQTIQHKSQGDEEMCYLSGMKYCTLVSHLGKKYGKKAVTDLSKDYSEIVGYMEELSRELPKRYELKSKQETPIIKPAASQPVQPAPANPQPAPPDPQPAREKGDVLNGVSGDKFITNKQLFDLLNSPRGASGLKSSVLIIDVRPAKDYESSHIKSDQSMSCPEEIIEKGKTASHYGTKIAPQYKALWDQRKFVDHLVLIDWSSTNPDLQENGPLEIFKGVIDKWDPGPKYVSCPLILDGGFENWNSTYPNLSTRSRVQAPTEDKANYLDIDDINYPNLSESPKGWSLNTSGIGNGGEPTSYNSFLSDNRYFSKKPPPIDRSSKANAELHYERNKRDQLELEKDIDRSKIRLDQIQHELIGKQTKELLDEKKKWEEKYNQLEKEHQFKEEENERLKQQIEELQQRERVAAARQVPKPRKASTATTNEPTEVTELSVQLHDPEEFNDRSTLRDINKDAVTNDDLSTVPLKQDHDALMMDLKRSRSTPNIAQTEWQRPPTCDRSTKPIEQPYGYRSTHRVYGSNRSGLTGLKNLGNTCYMNSIVQCISNTSKLAEYFCSERYKNDLNESRSNTGGEVARKVALVIRELWSGEYRSTGCEELKRVVGRHIESFAGTSQQDSHEFLTFLMDWLHNDLCRSPRKKLVNHDQLSGPKMAWAEYKKASDSVISELFFVQQVSTVVCSKCHEKSVTYEEPTSNLTLQLPSANNRCTLQDCLRLYTSGELISGYRCESCELTNDAIKKVDIWRLPQILVIHLKRFYSDGFYHKRQTLVDFPLKGLDMRDFTSNTETTNTKYDLYAVSNHYGTLEGGHYTAFCRNKEKWYKFDDQDVTEISPAYVKSPNAYILFYEQI